MATWKPDPEVAAVLAQLYAAAPRPEPPALGDVETRRANVKGMFTALAPPAAADVDKTKHTITGSDGHKFEGRLYRKQGAPTGAAAVLYLHGGGYIAGDLDCYDTFVARYVTNTGVPFFAPDYRLAPEVRYPTNVDDAHRALLYIFDHAKEWEIDPQRIAIMGDSGGGGLAAALANYNLEKNGPEIAKQILVYPMLDDRNVEPDQFLDEIAVWKAVDNRTGWDALLGDQRGKPDVKPSAAPARLTDAKGLPPTFIDCGELDIFRDEDIDYAKKFAQAGVSLELHIYPGCVHGFEAVAPFADVSQRAFQNRYRAIGTITATSEKQKL